MKNSEVKYDKNYYRFYAIKEEMEYLITSKDYIDEFRNTFRDLRKDKEELSK